MIIRPEDAAAVDRAREHARACRENAQKAGLQRGFVGHAYIAEAMKLFFDCDNDRALELASGLMVIAFADQKHGDEGAAMAEFALTRGTNDPDVVDRFQELSEICAKPEIKGLDL